MPDDKYQIRLMSSDEIDIAVDWAATEGWNPGLGDARCFHAADPSGFFVGLLGDEPIATISAVKYGTSFAFVGFYIVKPAYRGRGYGLRIWSAALATVGGRNVGLDGVVDQQANYRKSGFALAYRNIRCQGSGGAHGGVVDDGVVPLASCAFADVVTYDRALFPEDRADFLRLWIDQPGATAVGVIGGGALAGYAVMRACRNGYKIGPLFADTPEVADRLLRHLRSRVPADAPVFLDVPEVNAAAVGLVRRHGMSTVFETARMYTGKVPAVSMHRVFGVTTFELG
jgi:ribosomal protein S18 acetylase RimI-like enzyme